MEDIKSLLIICVTIVLVVGTIGLTVAHVSNTNNRTMNEMVQKGADPIHAKCAVHNC